uniref:Protein kinase domain-containing protein n=1 Tax=Parascaris univalens TaxID=6257 RepID=A0A915C501_PARUN
VEWSIYLMNRNLLSATAPGTANDGREPGLLLAIPPRSDLSQQGLTASPISATISRVRYGKHSTEASPLN